VSGFSRTLRRATLEHSRLNAARTVELVVRFPPGIELGRRDAHALPPSAPPQHWLTAGRLRRERFKALSDYDRDAIIEFLKSLQVLPPGTPSLVVDENGRPRFGPRDSN
jgi:hypothetical protein